MSLRARSIALTLAALALSIPVTVFTLDKAYTNSLTEAKVNELKLMSLALISAFELDEHIPSMPELLYEEQLNLPDSGYVGLIQFRDKVVWQSASALHYTLSESPPPPKLGEELFLQDFSPSFDKQKQYFAYAFTAEFAVGAEFEPVNFFIFNDKSEFNHERSAFLQTVWQWMLLLGIGLMLLLMIGTNLVLSPVHQLIREIGRTAQGSQHRLMNHYPVEFAGLKSSINDLLQAEDEQRMRYKNSLGDLAHSLKTPLAVALGTHPLPQEARDALFQIDQLIERQLKRASAGKAGWQSPQQIAPVLAKLVGALNKIYQHKNLTIETAIDDRAQFYGDSTDLMEMLGNIMDNACKAARSRIVISVSQTPVMTQIQVEDDGPGIPQHLQKTLIRRGERLDTYEEGQGIGMAVVADLVTVYQGRLAISAATPGGARITLQFPNSA